MRGLTSEEQEVLRLGLRHRCGPLTEQKRWRPATSQENDVSSRLIRRGLMALCDCDGRNHRLTITAMGREVLRLMAVIRAMEAA